ncbi:conserved Plasmodium protein, unknown function [Plasmodium ovale wallikeri]|uniref:Uncharacterized protein n=1 Tax=Plasmodium ovale wallikeri TaxID=864142 RepID=A0A1A8ZAJ7_PLAOA|nr:conserved Plasmodium protein, unknown function [Plasmodium ovale wallikeri]
MKIITLGFPFALLLLLGGKSFAIQLYGNDISSSDNLKSSSASSSNKILEGDTKFEASLKKFLQSGNGEDVGTDSISGEKTNNDGMGDENVEMGDENFIEENKEFIDRQILSDVYNKFIIDVVNNSTLNFLDSLKSEDKGNNEFQIELEESCSPFFCEKIMKAKEIASTNNSEQKGMESANVENTMQSRGIIINSEEEGEARSSNPEIKNDNEKEIKLHEANAKLVENMDSIKDSRVRNETETNSIFEKALDGNEENKQKIILTDGDNVYVLEEITQHSEFNDEDLNKQSNEQEIKMHIPQERIKSEIQDTNTFDYEDEETNGNSPFGKNGYVNNVQTNMERGIHEHDQSKVDIGDTRNGMDGMDQIDEDIFHMSEEELSKKIYEDIKMNSEDKIECHNFSKDEEKCNSFKKCTYVNIDNKDTCFLDYNYMLFLKNNNCALQSKSSLLSISKDLLKNEIIK